MRKSLQRVLRKLPLRMRLTPPSQYYAIYACRLQVLLGKPRGAVLFMDLEAKRYAAVVETVLRLLLQYRVRAWTRGLQVYESEHLSRLVGLLVQLRVGSLQAGGLTCTSSSRRQSQGPWRSET